MGILKNSINEISEKNSTNTILLNNATFTGLHENILTFSSLEVNIYSDVNSANNGIIIKCGQDTSLTTGVYIEYDTYTSGTNYHRIFPLKGKYFQILYINSDTSQSIFKLQTIKTNLPPNDNNTYLLSLLNEMQGNLSNINLNTNDTNITSNLTTINSSINGLDINNSGINSNLTTINNTLENLSISNTISVLNDETQLDSFGRLRISNPITLFENNNVYTKDNFYIDEYKNNNGNIVYQISNSAVILSTTNNTDRAIRQSHQYLHYQPGKSLLVYATGVLNPQNNNQSNVSTYIGYFDDENGVYFKHNNNNLYLGIRSNTSGTIENREVIQNEWNIDKMDGTGISGFSIDISKTQIFYMDIQWLGVGTVRTGFIINDKYYLIHKFNHANIRQNVYMTSANLPLRYEIKANGSTNTQGSLMEICCTVISEGGFKPSGTSFSTINTTARTITINNERALLAIRLKNNFKRASAKLLSFQLLIDDPGNDKVIYRLRMYNNVENINSLFSSGSTFTSVNNLSKMERTLNPVFNNINAYTNRIIFEGFVNNNQPEISDNHKDLFISSNITGYRDVLVLCAYGLSNTNCYGQLSWSEHI